jgi:hypothetical protein
VAATQESGTLLWRSKDFYLCVYATALGYLNFCISSYTIMDKKSSIMTLFEKMNDPIYLILPMMEIRAGRAFMK